MKTCEKCIHYDACSKGILSTKKDMKDVVAEYCPAYAYIPIPPCGVGVTLYRSWTCGGRKTVAKFQVVRVSNSGGEWDIEYQSSHSAKWSHPVIRHCKESDIGKTLFLSEEDCQ